MRFPRLLLPCIALFCLAASAPLARAEDNLATRLMKIPFTWETADGKASVMFNADGTGKQTFFNFTWRAKDAQTIELTMAGGGTAKAAIHFNADFTGFTGADFDGTRIVHGSSIPPVEAGTGEALKKAISNVTFTWEHDKGSNMEIVIFQPGGKGKHSFFNISWKVTSPHDVEVRSLAEPELGAITFHFSDDYTKYTAADFDTTPLHGHKINW